MSSEDPVSSRALLTPDAARLYLEAQATLSTTLARSSGEAFFQQAAFSLANFLEADMSFIGQLVDDTDKRLRTVALVIDGELQPDMVYAVEGTPCELVLEGQTRVIPRDVQRLFPKDLDLIALGAEAYGSAPLLDGSNAPIGNVGVLFRRPVRDPQRVAALVELFALRVATEVERQRGDARFRELFEFSPDAILMVAEDGRIAMANGRAEAIFGYPRDELVGMQVESLVPVEVRAEHASRRRRFLDAEQSRVMGGDRPKLYAIRRDGTRVAVEISLSPFDSPGGRMVVAAIRDVSAQVEAALEREKLQEQVRQAQKMEALGQLAGGIAHDFNNMLSVVLANVDLACNALAGNHPARAFLSEIRCAGDRAADLVRQILAFGRRQGLERRTQPAARIVDEALRLIRPVLPSSVEVSVGIGATVPRVDVDTTQAIQVIMNICMNAADALEGKPGHISITVTDEVLDEARASSDGSRLAPGRYARISVEDDGRGMEAETIARAFEPFYTTKPIGSGTGLGLSVALGIMQRHGGSIDVTSTPGQRTRFDLYFPAAAGPASPPNEEAVLDRTRMPPTTVLLVDDEALMVRATQRSLEQLGLEVVSFTDPEEALEAFQRTPNRFDLVVTDLCMPRRTGLEILLAIRQSRSELPVVVMSGHIDERTLPKLTEAGASVLLHKPWTPRELEEALRAARSGASDEALASSGG